MARTRATATACPWRREFGQWRRCRRRLFGRWPGAARRLAPIEPLRHRTWFATSPVAVQHGDYDHAYLLMSADYRRKVPLSQFRAEIDVERQSVALDAANLVQGLARGSPRPARSDVETPAGDHVPLILQGGAWKLSASAPGAVRPAVAARGPTDLRPRARAAAVRRCLAAAPRAPPFPSHRGQAAAVLGGPGVSGPTAGCWIFCAPTWTRPSSSSEARPKCHMGSPVKKARFASCSRRASGRLTMPADNDL